MEERLTASELKQLGYKVFTLDAVITSLCGIFAMRRHGFNLLLFAVALTVTPVSQAEDFQTIGVAVTAFYDGKPWTGGTIPAMLGASRWESAQYGDYPYVADCRNGSLSSHAVLHGLDARLSLVSIDKRGNATVRIVAHANHINRIHTEHMQGCDGQVVDAETVNVDQTLVVGDSPVTIGESGPIRIVAQRVNVIFN
jgi:hypothetical protein